MSAPKYVQAPFDFLIGRSWSSPNCVERNNGSSTGSQSSGSSPLGASSTPS